MRKIVIALVLLVVGIGCFAKEFKRTKYVMYHHLDQHIVACYPDDTEPVSCRFDIRYPKLAYSYTMYYPISHEEQSCIVNISNDWLNKDHTLDEITKTTKDEYCEIETHKGVMFLEDGNYVSHHVDYFKASDGTPVGFCGVLWVYTEPKSNLNDLIATLTFNSWTKVLMK